MLLSQEVVHDYQLRIGDRIVMRLLDQRLAGRSRPLHVRRDHEGIPDGAKDAYTVVNASYVARATHDAGVATLLVQTAGANPRDIGRRIRSLAGTRASVSDIDTSRALVASSLTSVELQGLTRVELAFALVLMAAATGLLLWVGLADRRRTFAIAARSEHARDSSAGSSGRRPGSSQSEASFSGSSRHRGSRGCSSSS